MENIKQEATLIEQEIVVSLLKPAASHAFAVFSLKYQGLRPYFSHLGE